MTGCAFVEGLCYRAFALKGLASRMSPISPHIKDVDPRKEWYWDLGHVVRLRSIILGALAEFGVSLAAFIWAHWAVGLLSVFLGAGLTGFLFFLRAVRIKAMESDAQLHLFCHMCRDQIAKSLSANSPAEVGQAIKDFNSRAVNDIAGYYRCRLRNTQINCAVRLAMRDSSGQEIYQTVARSDGMNPAREQHSEPIPSNSGLAAAIRRRGEMGVLLIPSIDEAIKEHIWLATKTDEYSDVQTLMVAPINGHEAGRKVMIGLLYVTSPKPHDLSFCPAHTIVIKAFADLLGLAYTSVATRIQALGHSAAEPTGG